MDVYRLYCLDGAGKIDFAESLNASDDEDAIQQAKVLKDGARRCEVWQRTRLVAELDAEELGSS
jgi:hypothetical protein